MIRLSCAPPGFVSVPVRLRAGVWGVARCHPWWLVGVWLARVSGGLGRRCGALVRAAGGEMSGTYRNGRGGGGLGVHALPVGLAARAGALAAGAHARKY